MGSSRYLLDARYLHNEISILINVLVISGKSVSATAVPRRTGSAHPRRLVPMYPGLDHVSPEVDPNESAQDIKQPHPTRGLSHRKIPSMGM
jgi:hypothetical protein